MTLTSNPSAHLFPSSFLPLVLDYVGSILSVPQFQLSSKGNSIVYNVLHWKALLLLDLEYITPLLQAYRASSKEFAISLIGFLFYGIWSYYPTFVWLSPCI